MNPALVAGVAIGLGAVVFVIWPVAMSAVTGRPLTPDARDAAAWGAFGIIAGLLLIVFLLIGTQP